MTAQEVERWLVFSLRHPFPADVLDIHCSMLASIVANIARDPAQPAFRPADFFVIRGTPEPPKAKPSALSEAERMLVGSGLR